MAEKEDREVAGGWVRAGQSLMVCFSKKRKKKFENGSLCAQPAREASSAPPRRGLPLLRLAPFAFALSPSHGNPTPSHRKHISKRGCRLANLPSY